MYQKFIAALSALPLVFACNSEPTKIRNDEVPVRAQELPVNIEVDGWTPSHEVLIQPIIRSIELQSSEYLPFDEPRTEYGQQDGKLRGNWYHAYMHKKRTYIFNGDTYVVLVKNNAPFVPQVCADFIIDTFDRAAGTWYRPSRKNPGRYVGNFDFRALMRSEKLYPRRVTDLVKYFHNHPEDFMFVFEGKGAQVGNERKVKQFLKEQDTKLGDLIFIRGKVPWDPKEEHSHSFFVTGFDEKGYVEHVTGNPVYPVKRRVRVEGARSPKRHVTHVIRLTRTFLEKLK